MSMTVFSREGLFVSLLLGAAKRDIPRLLFYVACAGSTLGPMVAAKEDMMSHYGNISRTWIAMGPVDLIRKKKFKTTVTVFRLATLYPRGHYLLLLKIAQ